jgi:hypothetical protein
MIFFHCNIQNTYKKQHFFITFIYDSLAGSKTCNYKSCPVGTEIDLSYSELACHNCTFGKYNVATVITKDENTRCKFCVAGYEFTGSTSSCSECVAGMYQNQNVSVCKTRRGMGGVIVCACLIFVQFIC